jgi:hypothetical protein
VTVEAGEIETVIGSSGVMISVFDSHAANVKALRASSPKFLSTDVRTFMCGSFKEWLGTSLHQLDTTHWYSFPNYI